MGENAAILVMLILLADTAAANYGVRLVDGFSGVRGSGETTWVLLENDLNRFNAHNQTPFAVQTISYANDMGWLHYMWVELGTPNTSFLVAVDTGSDMFWIPCDCVTCCPLSSSYYPVFDKKLVEYRPSNSSTSKPIPCHHRLCEKASQCGNPKGHCPYLANYHFSNSSSSGFLFEDQLHLTTIGKDNQQSSVHASIIIGCGNKQSGVYLDGIAPDGIMGLGPGDVSVPSMVAKAGVMPHAYSFCYDMSYSGRLYFGDQGPASQQFTYLLPFKEYRICLKKTGYQAKVDTGTSFTYLPSEIYKQVILEFERQANATSVGISAFKNCFNASLLNTSNIPSLKLVFPNNQSFIVKNLVLQVMDNLGEFTCLGMHPIEADIGIFGQNFMMGYRMVFDWEKSKLGWSISNCHDMGPSLAPSQQQHSAQGHAIAHARLANLFLLLRIAYVIII